MDNLNSLPDEILISIFNFVENKYQIRNVCRRWKNLVEDGKVYLRLNNSGFEINEKSYKEEEDFELFNYRKDVSIECPNADSLLSCLKYYSNVKFLYLFIDRERKYYLKKIISDINSFGYLNLNEIVFHFIYRDDDKFKELFSLKDEILANLTKIVIISDTYLNFVANKAVNKFLTKCVNLKYLHLKSRYGGNKIKLNYLPKKLIHFHVKGLKVNFDKNLNFDNLKHFGYIIENGDDQLILNQLPDSLTSLTIILDYNKLVNENFVYLNSFPNVKYLCIRGYAYNETEDEYIKYIKLFPNVEQLKIKVSHKYEIRLTSPNEKVYQLKVLNYFDYEKSLTENEFNEISNLVNLNTFYLSAKMDLSINQLKEFLVKQKKLKTFYFDQIWYDESNDDLIDFCRLNDINYKYNLRL